MNHLEPINNQEPQYEQPEEKNDSNFSFFGFLFNIIKSPFSREKKIGDLNGKWAVAFKLVLISIIMTVPTFFAWATWVTNGIYNSNNHICTTNEMEYEHRLKELEKQAMVSSRLESHLEKIGTKIDQLPHPEWRRRVEVLENQYKEIKTEIKQNNSSNNLDHQQIFILLESIKTTLELIKNGS